MIARQVFWQIFSRPDNIAQPLKQRCSRLSYQHFDPHLCAVRDSDRLAVSSMAGGLRRPPRNSFLAPGRGPSPARDHRCSTHLPRAPGVRSDGVRVDSFNTPPADEDRGAADASAVGSASDLVLLFYGRLSLDR